MDRGYKLVPEGLGNCFFDLLSELWCDKSSKKKKSLTYIKHKSHVIKKRNTGTRINTDMP